MSGDAVRPEAEAEAVGEAVDDDRDAPDDVVDGAVVAGDVVSLCVDRPATPSSFCGASSTTGQNSRSSCQPKPLESRKRVWSMDGYDLCVS